ncbi:MAG: hypothetical protein QF405_09720 [Roseibacillus sp.]|jgi:hypothetical protein|nr:hypothetical protein [Roseibacillus sp.]|tara:strand:- start:3350 stop:4462 length:1113 start_codon:yes stop_codon:yes gene_type:complete
MARKKQNRGAMGSLDSLLDTMTNVVGVLIVVLIVTQVNVSSAAKRIRANLPEVTVPMMMELREKDEKVQERLAELRDPAEVKPEEVEKAREELQVLVAERKELKETEARFKKLDLEVAIIEQKIEQLKQQWEAERGQMAQIRSEIEEKEDDLKSRKPRLVRLPNPRVPEKEAREVLLIVRGGRLLHFDRAAILDVIAAKIRPRKDLLSRDPKYKNRYDRKKIMPVLESLKESNPLYRFEFKLHPNGNIQLDCYPRDGKGETVEDLAKPRAVGIDVMNDAGEARNYLRFLVTRDSFEPYIAMRRMAEKRQIPVGWKFSDDVVRQSFYLHERKIRATPDPDWKPAPPKPPPPKPDPGKNPPAKKEPTEDILD